MSYAQGVASSNSKSKAKRQRPGPPKVGGANISPEGRQKLSELAKKRHAEGKFGGSEYGKLGGRGNTREKRRAAQSLAEHIRSEATVKAMRSVIDDGLSDDQAIVTRLKALEVATKIESEEAKISMQEAAAESAQMSRDELLAAIKGFMSKAQMQSALKGQIEVESSDTVIEGTVVEDG